MTKVTKIVDNPVAGVYYVKDANAIVSIKKLSATEVVDSRTTPKDNDPDNVNVKVALNGDNNMRPKELIEKARTLPAIPSALRKKAEMFYSSGWTFGKIYYGKEGEEGKEGFSPSNNMEIRKWLRKTNWDHFLMHSAIDVLWNDLVYVEIIKNIGGKGIAQVYVHKYAHCRFDFQKDTGTFNKCIISPNWEGEEVPAGAKMLPVLDPFYDVAGQVMNSTATNFIYPLFIPSVLENYYPKSPWQNFLDSHWYNVAYKVAIFNDSLVDNTAIAYHIEIAESWFEWKWPGFKDYPAEKKDELTTEAISVFIAAMKGSDKAGNVFTSITQLSPDKQKEYSTWKVTVIDNKYKEGAHLPTSQEAYSHLYAALGIDQSMIGPVPGASGGRNNGSGSEKRVAGNMQQNSQKYMADLIFKVFDLVRDVNGWDEEIIMRIRQERITTLDKGVETQQEAS